MTRKKHPKSSPFGSHHFPVGTIFELRPDNRLNIVLDANGNVVKQFEVASIVRNGADSYVVITTAINHEKTKEGEYVVAWICKGEVSYNISHVGKIIKRGDGPMRIRQQYGFSVGSGGDPVKKGLYYGSSVQALVRAEASRLSLTRPYEITDVDGLMKATLAQTFIRLVEPGDKMWCESGFHHIGLYKINMKRVKKFMKANHNRFLRSVRKAMAAEKMQMKENYHLYADLDELWDSELWESEPVNQLESGSDHSLADGYFDDR